MSEGNMSTKVHLEEIDEENWRVELKVSKEQERYVADKTLLMARAYAYRNARSQVKLIYVDKEPVGMLLYYDCDEAGAYDFSQIFVDERYQGKGYGSAAAKLALELMQSDGKYDSVILCYIDGNSAARDMYEKLGFVHTGEVDEDEIIMRKKLRIL